MEYLSKRIKKMNEKMELELHKYPNIFNELPFELLEIIFEQLEFNDILSLRRVNKNLHSIISNKYEKFKVSIPYFLLLPTNTVQTNQFNSSMTEIIHL